MASVFDGVYFQRLMEEITQMNWRSQSAKSDFLVTNDQLEEITSNICKSLDNKDTKISKRIILDSMRQSIESHIINKKTSTHRLNKENAWDVKENETKEKVTQSQSKHTSSARTDEQESWTVVTHKNNSRKETNPNDRNVYKMRSSKRQ